MTAKSQFMNLLDVLEEQKELKIIFTKANADTDGRVINRLIDEFAERHRERCIAFTSMGQRRYLSALKYAAAVAGNSSSGIIEAPSFGIPTVNIGDRQKGRMCAESVIHCGNEKADIRAAFDRAFSPEFAEYCRSVKNPYEGEEPSEKIVEIIRQHLGKGIERKKKFYNILF